MSKYLDELWAEMNEMKGSNHVTAAELSGQHLGWSISFDWVFPNSFVKARLSGLLKRVEHEGSNVLVSIMGSESAQRDGLTTEFIISGATVIELHEKIELMLQGI